MIPIPTSHKRLKEGSNKVKRQKKNSHEGHYTNNDQMDYHVEFLR